MNLANDSERGRVDLGRMGGSSRPRCATVFSTMASLHKRNDSLPPAFDVREGSRMELQLQLPGTWPVGMSRYAPRCLAGNDLEAVLTRLQEAEINA